MTTEHDDVNQLCLKQGFLTKQDALMFLNQYVKAQKSAYIGIQEWIQENKTNPKNN